MNILLPAAIPFSKAMREGSLFGVKIAALEEDRPKGLRTSVREEIKIICN